MAKIVMRDVDYDEISRELSNLFGPLSKEEQRLLSQNLSTESVRRNGVIYESGALPEYCFFLLTGKVKICKDGIGGRSQIVRVVKDGELFGCRAAFAGEHYSTSAKALEVSQIARVPLQLITQLAQSNGSVGMYFIRTHARLLGRSELKIVNLTQKHIRGRLAESLLALKDIYGEDEHTHALNLYLSREDLASLSNMTTSNAIRTLSGFASEKLVEIDGKRLKLLREDVLREISRLG